MRAIKAKRVLMVVMALCSLSLMAGCARIAGVAKDDYRDGNYYPTCLVNADRALNDARVAGKDKECPDEYNALKDLADSAIKTHLACNTDGACKMAQEVVAKASTLTCPPEPMAEVRPPPPPAPRYKYCTTFNPEFDICSAEIRTEYQDQMTRAGKFMQQYPDTTAVIEGHTDNLPITGTICKYKDNMALSQARAESAVNYLVEKFSIDRSRLTAKGYGDTRPIANNATNEGRQKNRRIEAIIDCAILPQEIKPEEHLCMTLQVGFDSGKSDVKARYSDEIAKLADYMKKYPTTSAIIEGHTDNVGSAEVNMKLSQQRAESVVTYLVDKFGIDRTRLSAKGYGETRPIAYNSTPEGRQKNRRIEAIVDCVLKQ
jgi:OmpA-OmpF porin, OOP family